MTGITSTKLSPYHNCLYRVDCAFKFLLQLAFIQMNKPTTSFKFEIKGIFWKLYEAWSCEFNTVWNQASRLCLFIYKIIIILIYTV